MTAQVEIADELYQKLLKLETATYWNTSVGSEVSTIIEPVQLQRDKRIEARKKLIALEARDDKQLKKGAAKAPRKGRDENNKSRSV